MFKLKSTLAACVALAVIGGIIACSSQLAKSGSGDTKTTSTPRGASTAANHAASTDPVAIARPARFAAGSHPDDGVRASGPTEPGAPLRQ